MLKKSLLNMIILSALSFHGASSGLTLSDIDHANRACQTAEKSILKANKIKRITTLSPEYAEADISCRVDGRDIATDGKNIVILTTGTQDSKELTLYRFSKHDILY